MRRADRAKAATLATFGRRSLWISDSPQHSDPLTANGACHVKNNETPTLGDILLARKLVSETDIANAISRQKVHGGRLGENLVALEVISQQQLDTVLSARPKAPRSIEETGLSFGQLLKLLIKAAYSADLRTPSQFRDSLMLPSGLIIKIIEKATSQNLLSADGTAVGKETAEVSYSLSEAGRRYAMEVFEQNGYVGPVPVDLNGYQQQIVAQKITNERIDQVRIAQAFRDLTIDEAFIQSIGPGINSGRCILLYGSPGNGKTSLAERIGELFEDTIYVPYAVCIDGEIMKVYDPSMHREVGKKDQTLEGSAIREDFDKRWVPCRRPVVLVGGELTLQMLDLEFNSVSKFYEAPIHLKAFGGTFIIDDFGRQFVKPTDLLNRWIVPLESRIDFMKLHSGKTFSVPFDELIIFATNLSPGDLMDPAFLRRIPYKLETRAPTTSVFRTIFERVCENTGLSLTDEIFRFVIDEVTNRYGMELAAYQPKFITDHIINACKFKGLPPQFFLDEVRTALRHLCIEDRDKLRNVADAA